ncbi:MAG: hypothetical protein J6Q35_01760, partial [Rikenellaceae bacterium]|nr:hypothetical protein [Rikenellaceae bacterium]
MLLKFLLQDICFTEIYGSSEREVAAVEFDSRKVVNGALFVAQRGVAVDGHQFSDSAVAAGAGVVASGNAADEGALPPASAALFPCGLQLRLHGLCAGRRPVWQRSADER